MATPGELVKIVAAVTDVRHATVAQHDRCLVAAGRRSKGGRGKSAATVNAYDAACLLTSVLSCRAVIDSAKAVASYSALTCGDRDLGDSSPYVEIGVPELSSLPRDHSFVDVLAVLVALAMDHTFEQRIGMEPGSCSVTLAVWPSAFAQIHVNTRWKRSGSLRSQSDVESRHSDVNFIDQSTRYYPNEVGLLRDSPFVERLVRIGAVSLLYIGAMLGGRLGDLPKLNGSKNS